MAEYIVRRMAEVGFRPSAGFEAASVTFLKDYADDKGRRARVHVFFDKPVMGMSGVRLANIVVSVQASIAPDLEAIEAEAPPVAQEDLREIVASFSELVGYIPEQTVAARVCVRCGRESAEYYVVNADAVCRTCVEERQAHGR